MTTFPTQFPLPWTMQFTLPNPGEAKAKAMVLVVVVEHLMVDVESYSGDDEQELLHLAHFLLDYSTASEHFAHVLYVHVLDTCMFAG